MLLTWKKLALLLAPLLAAVGYGLFQVIPDLYPVSFALFAVLVLAVLAKDRRKFERQSVLFLRRTTRGRDLLYWLGTHGREVWKIAGMVGVFLGFFFSVWMAVILLQLTLQSLSGAAGPGISLVLPSPTASTFIVPGVLGVPFWFWIISIAVLIVFHEGFHGIFVAREGVKIKSMGVGVLAVLPLAFVEPDEEELQKQPFWPQQRVYAAGSFANFLVAGAAALLLLGLLAAAFTVQGVAFSSYAAASVPASAIISLNGQPIAGSLGPSVLGFANRTLLELQTENATYLATPELIGEQAGRENIVLFEDYGAARAQLNGTIVSVDGKPIQSPAELRAALVAAGPANNVAITTRNSTSQTTYTVATAAEPVPQFRPDLTMDIGLWAEQYVPGTVDAANALSDVSRALLGGARPVSWQTIQIDRQFWQYAAGKFPALAGRAAAKLQELDALEQANPRAGYIGVAFVREQRDLLPAFRPVEGVVQFLAGLLAFLFLINFGVGAFNMLPIGGIGLDGYRMWQLVVRKVSKRREKIIMKTVSWLIIAAVVLNLALVFRGFG